MVSMTGRRAARCLEFGQRVLPHFRGQRLERGGQRGAVLHGLDQCGAQALVAIDASPVPRLASAIRASDTIWSSFAVCASSWATSRCALCSSVATRITAGAEGQARLGADHHHVQRVGQAQLQLGLVALAPLPDSPVGRHQSDHTRPPAASACGQARHMASCSVTPRQHRQACHQQDLGPDIHRETVGSVQPRRRQRMLEFACGCLADSTPLRKMSWPMPPMARINATLIASRSAAPALASGAWPWIRRTRAAKRSCWRDWRSIMCRTRPASA